VDETSQQAAARCVAIVGPDSLQNKLLAKLIVEHTGYTCVIRSPHVRNGLPGAPGRLVLLDAEQCDALVPGVVASGMAASIALINAEPGRDCERFLGFPGVKGVFYSNVSEEHFIKGIHALFGGEYWFPRSLLCAYLERTRAAAVPPVAESSTLLTPKELETLRLIATGDSTEHIAQALNVSPHTVKTHIYNLFRKINVSNRLQAVHWAARNRIIADLPASR